MKSCRVSLQFLIRLFNLITQKGPNLKVPFTRVEVLLTHLDNAL